MSTATSTQPGAAGTATKITGQCFCGANQFEITEKAVDTHHCHCSICRRLQGAPFVTLSIFTRKAFKWNKGGDLQKFDSSAKVHRHRCKGCGSPLTITFEGHEKFADLIAVMRSNLDKGSEPGHPAESLRHAFWPDRVDWLNFTDNVKKVDGFA